MEQARFTVSRPESRDTKVTLGAGRYCLVADYLGFRRHGRYAAKYRESINFYWISVEVTVTSLSSRPCPVWKPSPVHACI